jgi:hypothetical protein
MIKAIIKPKRVKKNITQLVLMIRLVKWICLMTILKLKPIEVKHESIKRQESKIMLRV